MVATVVSTKITNSQETLIIQRPKSGLSLKGNISIPGDKSISHHALMLGAIAQGQTNIQGLLQGEDPHSTARCFSFLGANISELNSESVQVHGVGLSNLKEPSHVLDCGNSGTTMRLMLGILASHPEYFFSVTGDSSLVQRPMSRVIQPLTQMGGQIWGRKGNSLAPLAIRGQKLRRIHYYSPIASAQVKSCILFAGLMAEGKTTVTEPALSRDHSERMLKAFGAEIEVDPETNSVTVNGLCQLKGQDVVIPGDISSAAFWLVAAAIIPGSELVIENVGVNPTRTGILEVLEIMEVDIVKENLRVVAGEPVADLRVRYSSLKACEISGSIIPRLIDEIPILAVAAMFAEGTTVIRDAAELRVKESDRLAVMATQLQRLGARVIELPDGLEITGGVSITGTDVESNGDHRVAMSLAIAALNSTGITNIHQAETVSISYPGFGRTLQQICS